MQLQQICQYMLQEKVKEIGQRLWKFSDLLSALKFAYSHNQRKLNLQTVRVMIDPSVTHYVAPSDFETTNPLIEEQALRLRQTDKDSSLRISLFSKKTSNSNRLLI
ncbi:hypothetical protein FGO68_gene10018 [Halteria grandinella]|uniref:Uncharacterized protein n=1 Tax=Halteria grandinella TaxID=5974 RepID=A0A8J8NA68_HALGN|nr:hypothetical protein FGO68_gene10018 [Halteria grandinella]